MKKLYIKLDINEDCKPFEFIKLNGNVYKTSRQLEKQLEEIGDFEILEKKEKDSIIIQVYLEG